MRTPISRVRSVTDTSMMFMMPMPPTSSEIEATHVSRMASALVVWSRVWRTSLKFCTKKSSP